MRQQDKDYETSSALFYLKLGMGVGVILLLYLTLIQPLIVAAKITNADHVVTSYEEFQEIYNTVQQICTDLEDLDSYLPEGVSGGFDKKERVLTKHQQLNRWVETYNAKSQMFTRSNWKGNHLPHQLDVNTVCNLNNQ